ncbi:MAG TPA: hypothetical protein PLO37_16850 [Candidatus Hydrogenedentes bacterium]|nr:hypothetical protein [Candidatus Hydrogenedentota bacterium]
MCGTVVLIGAVSLLLGGTSGQIAYVSGTEQEDHCVCILDLANGAVRRIGIGKCDGAPSWSPDGEWLAFTTGSAEGLAVAVVRADGSGLRIVSQRHGWNLWPRWSPDGKRLAYAAAEWDAFETRIIVCDLETGVESEWGEGKTGLMRPVWLNGVKLLYSLKQREEALYGASAMNDVFRELEQLNAVVAVGTVGAPGAFSTDLFIVTARATIPLVPRDLNTGSYFEWIVELSDRGSMIAVESNDGGDREIFVYSKRGMADVTNHREADWNPVWSPDGQWLAFESFRSGRRGVYRVYPETTRVFPVAVAADHDNWAPTWSPDGQWIAFVSDRTGDPEIYFTDASGNECHRVTDHCGGDYAPAWRPEVDE